MHTCIDSRLELKSSMPYYYYNYKNRAEQRKLAVEQTDIIYAMLTYFPCYVTCVLYAMHHFMLTTLTDLSDSQFVSLMKLGYVIKQPSYKVKMQYGAKYKTTVI